MWPVPELDALLPAHLRAGEDPHLLVLTCSRCGWQAYFSGGGATTDAIRQTAGEHPCTLPPGALEKRLLSDPRAKPGHSVQPPGPAATRRGLRPPWGPVAPPSLLTTPV